MSAELDPSGQDQGLLAQGHPPIGHAHSAFILAFANVAEVGRRASVESYAHANVAEVGRPASTESYPLANPCKILYGWMSEEAESCWMSEAANLASRKPWRRSSHRVFAFQHRSCRCCRGFVWEHFAPQSSIMELQQQV